MSRLSLQFSCNDASVPFALVPSGTRFVARVHTRIHDHGVVATRTAYVCAVLNSRPDRAQGFLILLSTSHDMGELCSLFAVS